MMKAAPAAPLVVAETDLLFELEIIALDQPAQLGERDQSIDRRVGRQRRQPKLGRPCFAVRPFDQQPFFGPRGAAPGVAVSRAHPQGGEARAQGLGRALAPSHRLPGVRRKPFGQSTHLEDRRRVPTTAQPRRSSAPAAPGRHRGLRAGWPDRRRAEHAHHVVQPQLQDTRPEIAVVAVARIRQHRARRHPFGDRRRDLRQRDLRLAPEHHIVGHARSRPTRGIVRPTLRKVYSPRDRQARGRRRHRQRDRHLAIVLLAQLPAILPRHADRMPTLLGKAGVVDDPRLHRPSRRHRRQSRLACCPQQRRLVPRRLADEVQQRLMLGRRPVGAQPRRHRLDTLTRPRQQQPRAVRAERPNPVSMPQRPRQPRQVSREPLFATVARPPKIHRQLHIQRESSLIARHPVPLILSPQRRICNSAGLVHQT